MASLDYRYTPDVVFPPGDTLRELLEARRMTQTELAEKLNMSEKAVSQLLNGKVTLTQETALKLERVVGVDASFWNNLEARYQEWLVREEEARRLEEHKSFVKKFPYREMVKRKWLPDGSSNLEKVRHLLNYFGVADPEAWERHWGGGKLAAFRKINAKGAATHPTAAWLRAGELAAQETVTAPYDRRKFKEALHEIRDLIRDLPPGFSQRMVELCGLAGVALVLMPELPKTGISGATRWIHKTPIIQLSIRYRYEDYFWFALFHESAHVLLHGKTNVFWRGLESDEDELQEKEDQADEWASNFLIPAEGWDGFINENNGFSREAICNFARSVSTSPGVVVGRLQHEKLLDFKFHNDLRRKFQWAETD